MVKCAHCNVELPPDAPHGVCPKCLMNLGLGNVAETVARRSLTLPPLEELSGLFPQLEVLELRGQGGMGAVFKARQKTLDRIVALKVLPGAVGDDPAFAERFTREARALAKLNHPNIVMVFDFGQVNGLYYFVMEYVDGVNLREAIAAEQLTSSQALAVVSQICDALQYAHDESVIHRDIKPENVLLDKQGRVKIADFGLAKLIDANKEKNFTLTGTQQVVGTMHYMAPEQMERPTEVDHRADIYSLGVVFYELLTGELPLGRFAPPSEKSDVGEGLDDVVLRSLEKEPDRRYQNASEIKTAVDQQTAAVPVAPLSDRRKSISLPFTVTDSLMKANGIVRMRGEELIFEFETVDQLFGIIRRPVRVLQVPISDLLDVRLREGLLSTTVTVQSDYLTTFDKFPKRNRGSISIQIDRNDRLRARKLVNEVRASLGLNKQEFLHDPQTQVPAGTDPLRPARDIVLVPSVMLLLMGLGCLLLPLITGSLWLTIGAPREWVITLAGIPMGVLLIMVSRRWYRFQTPRFCFAVTVLAALPIHVFFVFCIPFAVWAVIIMRRPIIQQAFAWTAEQDRLPSQKKIVDGAPPGAPRHQRRPVRRLFHAALAIVIIGGGIGGFYYYYNYVSIGAELTFEIEPLDKQAPPPKRDALMKLIRGRTRDRTNAWTTVENLRKSQLRVRVRRRYLSNMDTIRWRLERPGRLTIGLLANPLVDQTVIDLAHKSKSKDVLKDGSIVARWITTRRPPVEGGVQRSDQADVQTLVLATKFDISNDHVSGYSPVHSNGKGQIIAYFNSRGAERLRSMGKLSSQEGKMHLAVVIDDQLEFSAHLPANLPNAAVTIAAYADLDRQAVEDWATILRHPLPTKLNLIGSRHGITLFGGGHSSSKKVHIRENH